MMRILLCDDQEILLDGLQTILESVPDFEVIGRTRNGLEALEAVEQTQPDIVLMDLSMPVMNGVQATRKIHERYPDMHVLVLTTYDDDEWVFDAVRSGAVGYLLKDTPREQLIASIRGTDAGTSYIDPRVANKLLKQMARSPSPPTRSLETTIGADLSERELEILKLIADGLPNSEIAERLILSKGTVQNYVSGILTKLDVTDRTQAAIFAIRQGLVD